MAVQKKGILQCTFLMFKIQKSNKAEALLPKSATWLSAQPTTYKEKLIVED